MKLHYSRGAMLGAGLIILASCYAGVKVHPAYLLISAVTVIIATISAAQETRQRFQARQRRPLLCPECKTPLLRAHMTMLGLCPRCNESYIIERK